MFHRATEDSTTSKPDYRHVAPPVDLNRRKGYSDTGQEVDLSTTIARQKRVRLDDDYFDDDEDHGVGSSNDDNSSSRNGEGNHEEDDEEDDPLDAFMAGLEQEAKSKPVKSVATSAATAKPMSSKKAVKEVKGVRHDIDEEDAEESYYKYMADNPHAGAGMMMMMSGSGDEDEEAGAGLEYDRDGNPIYNKASSVIDLLPGIDHSSIVYEPFNKDFYEEHEEIKSLTRDQVNILRQKLGVRVFGSGQPKPVCSFAHFNFDSQLMKAIIKHEYTQPTPIQAQAIPIALSGRDLIGVAKTGSGKTAAYLWPLIVHIMDQRDLKAGEGPIGLILAPTRELTQQIYTEAKKFAKVYNIAVVCVYGGGNRWEQSNDLQAGCEIVVATPGRMIDMIKMKSTNLQRVTCLILDEADRMFDLGFEAQVRSICNHVRPDRQTMLFSATFKKRIEKLALDVLSDPLKIIQGESGEANQDITQNVIVLQEGTHKWDWLISKLIEFTSNGSVLIFVTKKAHAEELAANLTMKEFDLLLMHGDMDQSSRNHVITSFKRKDKRILVATDVAARGLDIPHVRTVINYDVARDIDTHTHRIGRTGRAGEKGFAYTLVTEKDKEFVGHLVRNLEAANQLVSEDLMSLAMKSAWFKNSRSKSFSATAHASTRVRKMNVGGSGLGFKSRTGFAKRPGPPTAESEPYAPTSSSNSSSNARAGKDNDISSPSSSSSSQAGDRVASMKAAFAAQYSRTFKAATDTSWTSGTQSSVSISSPSAPSSSSLYSTDESGVQKKKTRWN